MRACVKFVVIFSMCFPGLAMAQTSGGWGVLTPKSGGMDEGSRDTYQDLMASEIRKLSGGSVSLINEVCGDEACACALGSDAGVERVVFSSLSQLGQKWIVTATSVEVVGCSTLRSERLSVLRIEDLEEVAGKMAMVLVEGKSLEEATEVGNVTQKESEAPRLREGNNGTSLRVGGAIPISSLSDNFGVMVEVGYWFEGLDFAIEPRMAFQTSAAAKDGAKYGMFKLDASGHYLFSRGNISPYLGAGGGIRFVSEERPRDFVLGDVIQVRSSGIGKEEAWAPGLYLRGGVLFMRTYSTRLALNVDYDVTFIEMFGDSAVQTVNMGISVIF